MVDPTTLKIVETDASYLGFGSILKQSISKRNVVIRYYSGLWKPTQQKYLTIKKEILSKFSSGSIKTKKIVTN